MSAPATIGWDVGGVHTKAARIVGGRVTARASRVYEVQRAPGDLADIIRLLSASLGTTPDDRHAVTFTAELSQQFRSKAEGVAWVMDGVVASLPEDRVRVVGIDRAWYTPREAKSHWAMVAAANWMATARYVARHVPTVLLIDTGSTTTDIIPIRQGTVAASGTSDPERLRSGELVYTGAVRTPIEALIAEAPFREAKAGVAAEQFALTGDAHVWLGTLPPEAYTFTPDGRPSTREYCGERLARVICADRTMATDADLDAIAAAAAEAQVARIVSAIERVVAEHPSIQSALCVGLGAWIGVQAAKRTRLDVLPVPDGLAEAATIAPAAAAGLLLDAEPLSGS